MDRRDFIGGALTGLGAAALLSCLPGCRPGGKGPARPLKHWAWVGAVPRPATNDVVVRQLLPLRRAGISGLCVASEALEDILPTARDEGFEVQAWTWILCRPDQALMAAHPDWYMVNRRGESCLDKPPYVPYYRWLCPNKPEVQAFLTDRILGLTNYSDISTIQFDYIRYPDVILPAGIQPRYGLTQTGESPEYDYCYCPDCRRLFKEREGIDPLAAADPSRLEAWRDFRLRSVTGLVEHLAREVRARGKRVSAAVFPTPDIARRLVRQDWTNWDLDEFFPMLYHAHYNEKPSWVGKSTAADRKALEGRGAKLYSGIFLNTIPVGDVGTVVRGALEGGADGLAVFGGIANDRVDLVSRLLSAPADGKT